MHPASASVPVHGCKLCNLALTTVQMIHAVVRATLVNMPSYAVCHVRQYVSR